MADIGKIRKDMERYGKIWKDMGKKWRNGKKWKDLERNIRYRKISKDINTYCKIFIQRYAKLYKDMIRYGYALKNLRKEWNK